eukprot:m.183565 g.183565  ORF g.183565 m.183565 type:complete len:1283 (-) comp17476_c0_seq4:480-4328(-)
MANTAGYTPMKGDKVWIACDDTTPEAYVQCTVKEVVDGKVTCFDKDYKQSVLPVNAVFPVNPPHMEGVRDNTELMYLQDPSLLHNIRVRYSKDEIYTYTAYILIAVNPYKPLPLYGPEIIKQYAGQPMNKLPPHVYAVADRCYRSLKGSKRNQSIVVSGESGAGKTESCKHIMRFLASVGGEGPIGTIDELEQKILDANPILEAFGNAKTLRNNNSSRFGKYTEIIINEHGSVIGAQISQYLLEKSRVVRQAPGEQNFHALHYLFYSADARALGLDNLSTFTYLPLVSAVPDDMFLRRFTQLMDALTTIGFSEEDQRSIKCILAAVLHLGNVRFQSGQADEALRISTPNSLLQKICELLLVDAVKLDEALTVLVSVTRGEIIRRPHTRVQAYDVRDALAKALYGQLFRWIVGKINDLLAHEALMHHSDIQSCRVVGILDLFGFEILETNRLEQLCINVANEQLQGMFIKCVFKMEMEECLAQGIVGTESMCSDNKSTIDMFLSKPIGLFALLDEESHFPSATDESLVGKLNRELSRFPEYTARRSQGTVFSVRHFAGMVDYEASGCLEANRDTLAQAIIELCRSSRDPIVSRCFDEESLAAGDRTAWRQSMMRHAAKAIMAERPSFLTESVSRKRVRQTVVTQFSDSLQVLMNKMTACEPHFIRCIKPNSTQRAMEFDEDYVLQQLRYTGILETVRIRREGFAYRPEYGDFVRRFGHLLSSSKTLGVQRASLEILDFVGIQGYQAGETKLFLKYFHLEQLETFSAYTGSHATRLQSIARGFLARRHVTRTALRKKQENQLKMQKNKPKERRSTAPEISPPPAKALKSPPSRKWSKKTPPKLPPLNESARKPSMKNDDGESGSPITPMDVQEFINAQRQLMPLVDPTQGTIYRPSPADRFQSMLLWWHELNPISGLLPEWNEYIEHNPYVCFVDSCLRGLGQAGFMNTPVTGLAVLIAAIVNSRYLAFMGVLGLVFSTLFAHAIGVERGIIRAGIYGYNGYLVGTCLPLFQQPWKDDEWNFYMIVPVIVFSIFTVPVTLGINHVFYSHLAEHPVACFTFPFHIITWMFMLGSQNYSVYSTTFNAPALVTPTALEDRDFVFSYDPSKIAMAWMKGVGQVFFFDNFYSGIICTVGILLASIISGVAAMSGSAIGLFVGMLVGAPKGQLYTGLYGYDPVLACMCVCGMFLVPSRRTFWLSLFAALFCTFLHGAIVSLLTPFGLPSLTFAAACTCTLFSILGNVIPDVHVMVLGDIAVPEDHFKYGPQGVLRNRDANRSSFSPSVLP